jgi:hypothetical protein
MHNLISYNQLVGWKQSFNQINEVIDQVNQQSDILNDYYTCLIECEEGQAKCKRICKEVLEE